MDRVVVNCPHCGHGRSLPVATQCPVTCEKCGEEFWADTRAFDNTPDEAVREVLGPFADAARDMSFGRQPPPIATPLKGGVLTALVGLSKGACPHCRHVMSVGVTEARCPYCDHYSVRRDGYLQPIPEDYVSPSHPFNVPMGMFQRGELPAICCACGGPATRTVEVGSYALAPHCERHSVGGVISAEEGRFGVQVKSYRFYCAAMLSGGSLRF